MIMVKLLCIIILLIYEFNSYHATKRIEHEGNNFNDYKLICNQQQCKNKWRRKICHFKTAEHCANTFHEVNRQSYNKAKAEQSVSDVFITTI